MRKGRGIGPPRPYPGSAPVKYRMGQECVSFPLFGMSFIGGSTAIILEIDLGWRFILVGTDLVLTGGSLI